MDQLLNGAYANGQSQNAEMYPSLILAAPMNNNDEDNMQELVDPILLNNSLNTDFETGMLDGLHDIDDLPSFSQNSLNLGMPDSQTLVADEQPASQEINSQPTPYGSEVVVLENYAGEYNFSVTPIPSGKAIYALGLNKFYCDVGMYEFNVNLNFGIMRFPHTFTIRTVIVFSDPNDQNKPVSKCFNCRQTQLKLLDKDADTRSLDYIVRVPAHLESRNVEYITSERTHFKYLMIRLGKPEAGCTSLKQKLHFTCRSSCKSDDSNGINRRPTAMIFTLLNQRNLVVGRSVVNLRVCSAPLRDHKNETEPGDGTSKRGKKRKGKKTETSITVAPMPDTSPVASTSAQATGHHQFSAPKAPGIYSETASEHASASSSVKKVKVPSIPVDTNKTLSLFANSQESSQETVYEMEDAVTGGVTKLRLGKLVRDCRQVMRNWLKSENPVQRHAAMQLYECLGYAQSICGRSMSIIQEVHNQKQQQRNNNITDDDSDDD